MKKYLLVSISLLLIVAAILCPPQTIKPEIVAGAGTGHNNEITNAEEFLTLLDFFEGASDLSADLNNSGVESMAELIKKGKHKSGTYTISASSRVSRSLKTVSGYDEYRNEYTYTTYGRSFSSYNEDCTVYVNGDDCYYVSRGSSTVEYNATYDEEENEDYIINRTWDIEVYLSGRSLYIKVNAFVCKEDGEDMFDLSEVIGKWVKISSGAASAMISWIDYNTGTTSLHSISRILDYDLCEEIGKKKTYTHTFTTLEKNDSKFVIDFSNTEAPSVSIVAKGSEDGDNVNTKQFFTFYNIDNTVIEADIKDAEKLDMEDIERIFGGK